MRGDLGPGDERLKCGRFFSAASGVTSLANPCLRTLGCHDKSWR